MRSLCRVPVMHLGSTLLGSVLLGSVFLGSVLLGASPVSADQSEPTANAQREVAPTATLEPLVAAAERYRGLTRQKPLDAGVESVETVRETFDALLQEEVPEDVERHTEHALRMLGLWPKDLDLGATLLEVLAGEVAGYYDPRSDVLTLVEGQYGAQIPGIEGIDAATAERLESAIWVHEINHALQDQHFDLESLMDSEGSMLSDRHTARQALVEGDATTVMTSYLWGMAIERMPHADMMFSGALVDSQAAMAMAPNQSSEALANAPAFLQTSLLFPYVNGMGFCVAVRLAGGQTLLDHAFRNDPPESTEQILHPEKWLVTRDRPVSVSIPDLAPWLGGRRRVLEGDLGELGLRVLLRERLAQAAEATSIADAAAAGWGGDRLALYLDPDRAEDAGVLAWTSEWDDEAEAEAFDDSLSRAVGDTAAIRAAGTRVSMVMGLDGASAQPVLDALHAAPVTRPLPESVDLATFGIGPEDVPRPLDAEALAERFRDPAIQGILRMSLGAETTELIASLAESPEALETVLALGLEAMTSGDGANLEAFFAELSTSPEGESIQASLAGIMTSLDARAVGRSVLIDDGRLVLELPAEGQWRELEIEIPEDLPPAARPALQLQDAESGLTLVIVALRTPMPMQLEAVAIGARAAAGDAPVDERFGEVNGIRFWEMEVTVPPDARMINRALVVGGNTMVSLAVAYQDTEASAQQAQSLLATVRVPSDEALAAVENANEIEGVPVSPPSQVLAVEGEVLAPRKRQSVAPTYPSKAKREGVEGRVIVRAIIRKDGTVDHEIEVLESPDRRLSKAAIKAMRQWRFAPATLDGVPVDVYFNLTVNFRL